MDFDFENCDPENLNDRPMPGKYHVLLQSVDENDPKIVAVDYEILSGTVNGQEGRTGRERIFRHEKDSMSVSKRLVMFALASGLTSLDAMVQAKQGGKKMAIDLQQAEGRQICVELMKDKTGQFTNWSYRGIWACDAPESADIPKNEGMLGQTAAGDPLKDVNF
jgi:hypothetical protein